MMSIYDKIVSRLIRIWIIILFSFLTQFSTLFAEDSFPVPDALEQNIEFWVNIFSIYSENEVLIHDTDNLDIIYEIINLNDFFPESASMRVKWKKIKSIINNYRKILLNLADNDHIVYDQLTDIERNVYLLWLQSDKPNKYRVAANNIRGQRGLKQNFKLGLKKSGKYIPEFRKIFRSYNLPEELCYLPHVESSFTNRAYSKSGATGLWQFIRSTGRLYLKINHLIDERLDPFTATDAAAKLLRENYKILGSWALAITAYNHGLNGMKNAKYSCRTNDFGIIIQKYKSRSFGFASKNFYAEFLAVLRVVNNYEFYFGSLEFDRPIKYTNFIIPENINIDNLLEKLALNKELLIELNPAWRAPVITSRHNLPKGYKIKIPFIENYDPYLIYAGIYKSFDENLLASIDLDINVTNKIINSTQRATTFVDHNLTFEDNNIQKQSNENIFPPQNEIFEQKLPAAKQTEFSMTKKDERVSISALPQMDTAELNTDTSAIAAVTTVNAIPVKENSLNLIMHASKPIGPEIPKNLLNDLQYDVDLSNIYNFDVYGAYWIKVLPEETIGHYADWLNLPTNYLRKINGQNYRKEIRVGQRFKLAFSHSSVENFNKKRLEYHHNIQNNFFSEYHIIGTITYEIQPGDNIWKICNQKFNVPYWLIAYYNQDKKWSLLTPGDSINIPIISPFAQKNEKEYSGYLLN